VILFGKHLEKIVKNQGKMQKIKIKIEITNLKQKKLLLKIKFKKIIITPTLNP
jgi:hypothetical protein